MTWLTVTEYLCYKRSRKYAVCRNHNLFFSSFMSYHQVCNKSNTTCATSGAKELLTFPGHMSSHRVCGGLCCSICYFWGLFCVNFCLFPFHFCQCIVCLSLILRHLITPLVSSNFSYKQ
jgi:hypothetical protein